MATIGEEKRVTAISHLSVTASWSGLTANSDESNAIYNPPSGWVILETETAIHSSSNGSREVSVIAGGLDLIAEENINQVYDAASNYAVQEGNYHFKAQIDEKRGYHREQLQRYKSNTNTVMAQVRASAHGSPIDRMRGWEEISVYAQIIYLGNSNLSSVHKALEEEFGISFPATYSQLTIAPAPGGLFP